MNLKDVDGHATSGGQLLLADMALEVLRLLVLHQNLFVVELPITVVAPYLISCPLLLLPHPFSSFISFPLHALECNHKFRFNEWNTPIELDTSESTTLRESD